MEFTIRVAGSTREIRVEYREYHRSENSRGQEVHDPMNYVELTVPYSDSIAYLGGKAVDKGWRPSWNHEA